jgi:dienelactone hydrolase
MRRFRSPGSSFVLAAALLPLLAPLLARGDDAAKEAHKQAFDHAIDDLAKSLAGSGPTRLAGHDALVAALGGETTGEASEPAIEAKDDEPATARALSLFVRPAGKFAYRLVEEASSNGKPVRHDTYVRSELFYPSAAHTTDPSDVVHGWYYAPKAPQGRVPAAIVVHHLGGSFEAEEILAQFLAQQGVAAATIALPGYGPRRAEGQPRAGFLGHRDPLDDLQGMRQAVLDVRRAADVLRSRPEVDPEHTGVVGISLGAIVASVSAGIDARFARAVFVIGGGDFMKVLTGPSKEAAEAMKLVREANVDLEDLKRGFDLIDPLTFAHRLRSDDVLMLNAEKDEIFPRDSTLELWRTAGYPRIKWYNTGHYGLVAHLGDVMNETVEHLRDKAPAREPD